MSSAAHIDVKQICSVLSCMSDDFQREAVEDCGHSFQLDSVAGNISAALVLLRCAEDKLMDSIPLEELMSPEELKVFLEVSEDI